MLWLCTMVPVASARPTISADSLGALPDIEELLELSSEAKKHHHIKVRRGLRVSIHRFEESHPRLTGVMSRLLDMLAGMGV